MTNADYPITATSQVIFRQGQGQPATGLKNTGTSPIYLASIPQSAPSQGFALNANAVMTWDAGTYLAAMCDPGASSTLQLLDAPVQFFDPSSVANAMNLTGVPAVDAPAVLFTRFLTGVTAVASGATPPDTTVIDCRKYEVIFVNMQEASVTNNTTTRNYTFSWYTDASAQGNTLVASETIQMATFSGQMQAQRQVRGGFLVISATAAATVNPSSLTTNVYGSLRTANSRTLLTSGRNNATGLLTVQNPQLGMLIWTGSIGSGGASLTEYANARMGCNATLLVQTTNSTTDIVALDLRDWAGNTFFSDALPASGGTSHGWNLWLPPVPLSMFLINFSTGAASFRVSLVAEPQ